MVRSRISHLFVYGTLKKGHKNAHVLTRIGGRWQPARVRGSLRKNGCKATLGFPALMLAQDDQVGWVSGWVFSSCHLGAYWPELDTFERPGYRRVQADAVLATGTVLKVFVYVVSEHDFNGN